MLSLGAAAQGHVAVRMGWGTVYSWELGQLGLKDSTCSLHIMRRGASQEIKRLRLQASAAGGVGLIPGWGTEIPRAEQCGQKIFKN